MLEGTVQSGSKATLERLLFVLEPAGSAAGWAPKLEQAVEHPLHLLKELLIDDRDVTIAAMEPLNAAAKRLTVEAFSGAPLAAMHFPHGTIVRGEQITSLLTGFGADHSPDVMPWDSPPLDLPEGFDIMVCVHASRDERCGCHGPELLRHLELAVQKATADGNSAPEVRLWGTSHTGGHRFAPNAIVFPSGDWFGQLEHEGGANLLLHAIRTDGFSADGPPPGPLAAFWRGKVGLSKLEQKRAAALARGEDVEPLPEANPWRALHGLDTTIKIARPGFDESREVEPGNTVTVHATGRVEGADAPFWSTRDPGQKPFTYKAGVGEVIPGWDQGCLGMKAGEQRLLRIPPAEGYGAGGFPAWGIPPQATLLFELECTVVLGQPSLRETPLVQEAEAQELTWGDWRDKVP